MSKLTHAEHAARAMLMGRVYDWRDGTYCLPSVPLGRVSSTDMIDAMTLEPISSTQALNREKDWGTIIYSYTDPPIPTPYGEGEL